MITLAPHVWHDTIEQFQTCGGGQRECVVYWVGPAADASVADEVVHPSHEASPGDYEIDKGWLNQFWITLAERGRSVRVQVHTHAGRAFHSHTDDRWPVVQQKGFLSLVLPRFARDPAPRRSELYLARLGSDFKWRSVDPAEFLRGLP